MSLVKLFDFVEEDLSPRLVFEDLENDSDFLEKYVLFEECLDRVLENILESELRVFYSKEANEFVRTLEGEKLNNLLEINSYLKKIYLDENK
jgi:hypothetical protein